MWWKRLKAAMDAKGLSHQELADLVHVPRERIYDYLKGKTENPRGDMMEQLAKALDLDVEYLHRGTTPDRSSLKSVATPNIPLLTLAKIGKVVDVMSILSPDTVGETIAVPVPNPDKCFGVTIDNSANNPEIGEHDILVFDCEAAPEPGSYVLAILTESETAYIGRLKPLIHNNLSEFVIRFANGDYPDITVNSEEPGKIVARAILKCSPL